MHALGTQSQGDTQPASPWVYKKLAEQYQEPQPAPLSAQPTIEEEERDSGYVDLLGCFNEHTENSPQQNGNEPTDREDDDDDDVDLVSQDVRAEIFPESKRFQPPKTPLTQGIKRKRDGPSSGLQNDTPRLPDNFLAGFQDSNDRMGHSQLFEATQALTSPNLAHSDGLYNRPSPNFNQIQRPSTADSASSPASFSRLGLVRPVSEPQAVYISMQQSQEAREAAQRLLEEDSSEDNLGFNSPKTDKGYEHSPAIRFMNRTPPSRLNQHIGNVSKQASANLNLYTRKSPCLPGRSASDAFPISDDISNQDPQDNVSEEETDREGEDDEKNLDDEIDELAEDNKENVEVPMTVSRLHQGGSQIAISQSSPSQYRPQGLRGGAGKASTTHLAQSPISVVGQEDRIAFNVSIRDSQSSQKHKSNPQIFNSSPAVGAGLHSSLESRNVVLQSQLSQSQRSPNPGTKAVKDPARHKAGSIVDGTVGRQSRAKQDDTEESSEDELSGNGFMPQTEKHLASTPSEASGTGTGSSAQSCHPHDKGKSPQKTAADSSTKQSANIPETCSPAPEGTNDRFSAKTSLLTNSRSTTSPSKPVDPSTSGPSTTSLPFETAPERQISSQSGISLEPSQTKSSSNHPLPSKLLRRRTLGEIADESSPPDPLGDIDVNINLLSTQDVEFQAAVHGSRGLEPSILPVQQSSTIQHGSRRNRSFKPVDDFRSTPDNRPTTSQIERIDSDYMDDSDSLSSPPDSPDSREIEDLHPDNEMNHSEQEMTGPSASEVRAVDAAQETNGEVSPQEDDQLEGDAEDSAEDEEGTDPIVASRRVFAHFNGTPSAFYTATCTGFISGEDPRYSVRFDDGAIDTIGAFGIKRLELRPGDLVKVDQVGARTKNFLVVGMKEQVDLMELSRSAAAGSSGTHFPATDIHGYSMVTVAPKSTGSNGNAEVGESMDVPLAQIYITQTMWTHLKDRNYLHFPITANVTAPIQTPCERPSTPSSPSSRTRRSKPPIQTQSRSDEADNPGLLHNMVFTLTNIIGSTNLDKTKKLIQDHGGTILDEGFSSLFHIPVLHRSTSPHKSDADRTFHLTRSAEKYGFTCLIADKHCRRAKYIQAIALGLPCLATRWIQDCVNQGQILPWAPYLLPAGESAFLGHGAIHSRTLPSFPTNVNAGTTSASTVSLPSLAEMLQHRSLLLNGTSILILMRKGDDEDTMKQYPLLTFAIGPARVARAITPEAAAREVRNADAAGTPWDWVLTCERARDVERILFGTSGGRASTAAAAGEGTRVVGNEWLIQSLIAGRLVD